MFSDVLLSAPDVCLSDCLPLSLRNDVVQKLPDTPSITENCVFWISSKVVGWWKKTRRQSRDVGDNDKMRGSDWKICRQYNDWVISPYHVTYPLWQGGGGGRSGRISENEIKCCYIHLF